MLVLSCSARQTEYFVGRSASNDRFDEELFRLLKDARKGRLGSSSMGVWKKVYMAQRQAYSKANIPRKIPKTVWEVELWHHSHKRSDSLKARCDRQRGSAQPKILAIRIL